MNLCVTGWIELATGAILYGIFIMKRMFCTMAIRESGDGEVKYSERNLPLMATLFNGNVVHIMGGPVVEDESRRMAGIIQY